MWYIQEKFVFLKNNNKCDGNLMEFGRQGYQYLVFYAIISDWTQLRRKNQSRKTNEMWHPRSFVVYLYIVYIQVVSASATYCDPKMKTVHPNVALSLSLEHIDEVRLSYEATIENWWISMIQFWNDLLLNICLLEPQSHLTSITFSQRTLPVTCGNSGSELIPCDLFLS